LILSPPNLLQHEVSHRCASQRGGQVEVKYGLDLLGRG
jgi:hypothetical protein